MKILELRYTSEDEEACELRAVIIARDVKHAQELWRDYLRSRILKSIVGQPPTYHHTIGRASVEETPRVVCSDVILSKKEKVQR